MGDFFGAHSVLSSAAAKMCPQGKLSKSVFYALGRKT